MNTVPLPLSGEICYIDIMSVRFVIFLAICGWSASLFGGESSPAARSVISNTVASWSPVNDNFPRVTNSLAFYVLTFTNVSAAGGKMTPHNKWSSTPILSDADFAGWDETNHYLIITPKAAKRVYSTFGNRAKPTSFGVIAGGKQICEGSFTSSTCNTMGEWPEICVDFIPTELNVTREQWNSLQYIRINQQINKLTHVKNVSTNELADFMEHSIHPTNNVALMPGQFDDRVAAAVKKLLANPRH